MTADTLPATRDAPATVRLAEVLAALSPATDAGNGFPPTAASSSTATSSTPSSTFEAHAARALA